MPKQYESLEDELAGIEKDIAYKALLYSNEMPDYVQELVGKWFEVKNKIAKGGK